MGEMMLKILVFVNFCLLIVQLFVINKNLELTKKIYKLKSYYEKKLFSNKCESR